MRLQRVMPDIYWSNQNKEADNMIDRGTAKQCAVGKGGGPTSLNMAKRR